MNKFVSIVGFNFSECSRVLKLSEEYDQVVTKISDLNLDQTYCIKSDSILIKGKLVARLRGVGDLFSLVFEVSRIRYLGREVQSIQGEIKTPVGIFIMSSC